jgi:hypothetical protein
LGFIWNLGFEIWNLALKEFSWENWMAKSLL